MGFCPVGKRTYWLYGLRFVSVVGVAIAGMLFGGRGHIDEIDQVLLETAQIALLLP